MPASARPGTDQFRCNACGTYFNTESELRDHAVDCRAVKRAFAAGARGTSREDARSVRGEHENSTPTADQTVSPKGATPAADIRSGDLQGLPDQPQAESESVRELADEGQGFEAALVDAIENAPPADQGEIKTREAPEDDVPPEYTPRSPEEPKE